jgi:hypothetical protein
MKTVGMKMKVRTKENIRMRCSALPVSELKKKIRAPNPYWL